MKRRLFIILAALSMLLGIAATVFWIRSHHGGEALYRVSYVTDVSPNRHSVTGIESSYSCLILIQGVNLICLTPEKAARGTSSDFGELSIDRGDRPEQSFPTVTVWLAPHRLGYSPWGQVSPPPSIWQQLGFHDYTQRGGYQDWVRRVFIPKKLSQNVIL